MRGGRLKAYRDPLVTAAAVLAAGLLTAGCGAGNKTRQAAHLSGTVPPRSALARLVSDAARRTLSLTATIEFRLDGARAFGPARAPVFGQGVFDFRAGEGKESVDLPEAARQELGNEQAIIFPARVFLQPKGTNSAVLPRGKRWMSATIAGSGSVSTNFPNFVGEVEGINPMLALAELAAGTQSARPLGEQLVDHVPTQRYRVSIDLARTLGTLTGRSAPALGAAIQQQLSNAVSLHSAGGVPTTAADVWVDRTSGVLQYQVELPGTGDGTALVLVRPSAKPLHIDPPAPSEVVDITALTPSGERENNGGGDADGG